MVENFTLKILILYFLFRSAAASYGDQNQFFQNCKFACKEDNCTKDGVEIKPEAIEHYHQSTFDRLFHWTCLDECVYECMWRTVDVFKKMDMKTPQFHGKWPFKRFLGLQEPASVLFSLFNLASHIYLLMKFRKEVRPSSPCYLLWHIFSYISMNGWVWSTVFHTRDFPLTELLDYTAAYLIVLSQLYCMIIRMIHKNSQILKGGITVLFISFYLHYFSYLSVGKFSYSFNMKTNIITGIASGIGWLIWCIAVRKTRPYYKIMLRFYFLVALSMILELMDFPPILWTFDAHALWHLSTVPINFLFYKFITYDCKMLRKEELYDIRRHDKEI